VFGPPKLPAATTERINEALNAVLKLPDVRERLVGLGFDPRGGTADGFASHVKTEVEKWGRVIRSTGIAPA
jgi:tripartite-type tricarboxylate transporter receptor subunit TctC